MHYFIGGIVGFVLGVILTLIFRVRVENKLKAEAEALKAAANRKLKL